jgi:presenilin-like A22 family membrane protease
MRHSLKITLILLGLFLVTQFIGLFVLNAYSPIQATIINPETGLAENVTLNQQLPYGMQPPELRTNFDFWSVLPSIIIAFVIAVVLIMLISRFKWKFLLKGWFFVVVSIAVAISLYSITRNFNFLIYPSLVTLGIAAILSFFKIFKPNMYIHNFTELLIYPGIATIFVSIFNVWTLFIFLFLISIYDMWAVWKSKIMIKMAKFHIEELNVFPGLLITHASKKVKNQIRNLKKQKKLTKKQKNKKFKVSLAILGGGDIAFTLIAVGVFFRAFGLLPALVILAGGFLGLSYLMFTAKKKSYPAMPFITTGIFLAAIINWLFII